MRVPASDALAELEPHAPCPSAPETSARTGPGDPGYEEMRRRAGADSKGSRPTVVALPGGPSGFQRLNRLP